MNTIHLSGNIEYIRTLPDNSVDSIITDSPYGLGKEPDPIKLLQDWIAKGYHEVSGKGFLGKEWDAFVPQPILWKECFRVLKPGGYLLSFFGTRTYDWGTLAIRLAGFEIRDCIPWIYASGFPKGKACLKPAIEPICVARKPGPLQKLNIDDCRIPYESEIDLKAATTPRPNGENYPDLYFSMNGKISRGNPEGRYPSNVMFDELAAEMLDNQVGIRVSGGGRKGESGKRNYLDNASSIALSGDRSSASIDGVIYHDPKRGPYTLGIAYNDSGGASRFFYVAKASPTERKDNPHPTVKPVKLISQLVKLFTPKGGVCLDPHMGSGTLPVSCIQTDWCNYIAVDADIFSYDIAVKRIARAKQDKKLS